ncbi:hypothetical protein B566_EDAN009763 [Ephemera danica]|nr:hypothetical protein B566_EDAN009763 [Ephemera danica]
MDTKQSHKMSDEEDVVYLGEVRAGDEVEFSEDEEEIIMASWTTSHTISFQAAAGHMPFLNDETKNGPNETMLFHGSTKCLEIVKKGFDERLASSNSIFGAGVYFAEHSSKSNGYTGCGHLGCMQCPRRMILCRVALGNMYECTGAHKFAHAPPGHHSVKGFAQAGDVMYPEYVVYRGEQACPEYLITYKIVRETR